MIEVTSKEDGKMMINEQFIESMIVTLNSGTQVTMVSGDIWLVAESIPQIHEMIQRHEA